MRHRIRIGVFGQVGLCVAVLVAVWLYNHSRAPIVDLLGLAHTQLVSSGETSILILDHLSSSDAPVVAQAAQAEVWGRHHAQGLGLLVPMAAVALAAAGLVLLALWFLDESPPRAPRKAALPPAVSGLPLFLGACFAAGRVLSPLLACLPWLMLLLAVVGRRWSGRSLSRGHLFWIHAARWFWLGYLLLSSQGFFRWESDTARAATHAPTWLELLMVGALVWGIRLADLRRKPSPDRTANLAMAELWIVLPIWGVAMAAGALNGAMLPAYLLACLASACLADGLEPEKLFRPLGASLLLAGLALSTTLSGGVPRWEAGRSLETEGAEVSLARARLQGFYSASQARLADFDGIVLLVTCNLDLAQQSEALALVSSALEEQPASVVVRSRRWERVGRILLASTVSIFLVVPTFLLTVASPGRRGRLFRSVCVAVAASHFAFALGAAMGWFWLDPLPHLGAFGLAFVLAWFSLGHARAWVDSWINDSVRRTVTSV